MTTSKSDLRQQMRAVRASIIDGSALADRVAQHLLEAPHVNAGPTAPQAPHLHAGLRVATDAGWFVYVSYGEEVDTHGLIRALLDRDRTLAVPRIMGEEVLVAQRIASFAVLRPGRFGILAPPTDGPVVEPDVVVLPCLALTPRGDRLGSGGGYYDRYLAAHPDATTIALAFDEQVVEALPVEPHDHRVDFIVTPTRVIRCA